MSVGRDGRQGWSRESEAAWERIFGRGSLASDRERSEDEPQTVAFPDHAAKLYEGFK